MDNSIKVGEMSNLKQELDNLKSKKAYQDQLNNLKTQIKREKFNQSKSGRIFNVLGKVGGTLIKNVGNMNHPSNLSKTEQKLRAKKQKDNMNWIMRI